MKSKNGNLRLPIEQNIFFKDFLDDNFKFDDESKFMFKEQLKEFLLEQDVNTLGSPSGSVDSIVSISEPPFYTACPNNFIKKFLGEKNKENFTYAREPFVADVSEGKTHPAYISMAYHTKVPHRAVMRYILHYTNPGDILFDGFCGSGMTGVAAKMCADKDEVEELGYHVAHNGRIYREIVADDGSKRLEPFSWLGARRVLLNDLSPAATFISNCYQKKYSITKLLMEIDDISRVLEDDFGWAYLTIDPTKANPATIRRLASAVDEASSVDDIKILFERERSFFCKINYTIWSDVFYCNQCGVEVILWENAVDSSTAKVLDFFSCPGCSSSLTKRDLERSWVTKYDQITGELIKICKQVPVAINFSDGHRGIEKKPDELDIALLNFVDKLQCICWVPTNTINIGDKSAEQVRSGIDRVHLNYHYRSLLVLSRAYELCKGKDAFCIFFNMITRASKQSSLHVGHYFKKTGGVCKGHLTGTLYVPSLSPEIPVTKIFKDRANTFLRGIRTINHPSSSIITTQSTASLDIEDDTFDYIFVDPPFGSNLNYSELNFIEESWLQIFTNKDSEAIQSQAQNKDINSYRCLMTQCFKEMYRVLKPGRWMTVEFSNTQAVVWNAIQTALSDAGFVTANVSALDKKQGGFNAVNNPISVKQDLVISAYKPNGGFENRFLNEAQTEEGVWDFVRTHLNYLPVIKQQGSILQFIPERDPRILFDQVVAYYVRKGFLVPISSQEFQVGVAQRFIERDGMYFLPDQVAEYDRKKMTSGELKQMAMFVSDEASAIQWLRQLLKEKPQTFSDINPQFMQQLGGWSKNEAQLDLRELLNQNFLCYNGKGPVPEQIHAYLSTNWKELRNLPKDALVLVTKARDRWYVPDPNKAGDLEKLREKALLKEFEEYKEVKKKLKVFRLEAVRAGFKKAWQERDYAVIVAVADKIPNNVLEEDPKLLMWYDQAVTRMGGE